MTSEFPGEGEELTHILVVSDMDCSRTSYRDVLGASSSVASSATPTATCWRSAK